MSDDSDETALVAYARDQSGIEVSCVQLERRGRWLHMCPHAAALLVCRGAASEHRRGRIAHRRTGDEWWAPARSLSVIEAGDDGAGLLIVAYPAALHGRAERGACARVPSMIAALADSHPWVGALASEDLELEALFARAHARPDERAAFEPAAVRRARIAIERLYRTPPSLDEMARDARVSKYHLIRVFHAYHGVPPHTYARCYRISHGRALLASGRLVSDTAHLLGFGDHAHFTRQFRRVAGVPPSLYARADRCGR